MILVTRLRILSMWALVASAVALAGCGGPTLPAAVPVRGTVTYNGQPLTNGTVAFSPTDPAKGRAAQAQIGSDGTFVPSTFAPGDGLMAGSYSVSVTSSVSGSELGKDKGTGIGGKSAIPANYSDPKKSGLTQTIGPEDAGKAITLELKGP